MNFRLSVEKVVTSFASQFDTSLSFCLLVDFLQIKRGEVVCITGKSGAGKTVLLHILAGVKKAE